MTTQPPHAMALRPWEQEQTFQEHLGEWMDSAPWFALSSAAHLLAFFVLSAFPWSSLQKEPPPQIVVSMPDPVDLLEDDPVDPLEPIELPDDPIDEPVISDATLVDADTDEDVDSDDFAPSDVFSLVRSDFAGEEGNQVIGIAGGAAGGGINGRGLGRQGLGKRGGKPIEDALENALDWLARHQSPDGSWDCDGFDAECGAAGNTICDGPGRAGHDVGATGLALLAFLGEGGVPGEGRYGDVLSKGIFWLREQQDPDTGLLGDASTHEYLYNHAIGTLALCEAYLASNSPRLKRPAQSAIHFINRARNPYGAWRYESPPVGTNDTSVTGWMIFAIKAAEDAGLQTDEGAYDGAMAWLEEVTDPQTGRVGYNEFGSRSSRITGVNDHFPSERGEAMTAVGLLCRVFMGQSDPDKHPIL
ncbi:MAG: terpene cyclase/mutase family protein, partial [Planctomycetota bacterium]|nr:terpene cyclase/mutase family protein [Planctomycetota bacterium]